MGVRAAGVRRASVEDAARVLAAGGLVAHPTSTVYGIGGRPTPALDHEIARLKGRAESRPLIRLAGSLAAVRSETGAGWSERAETLAARFWPGPLTLVVPRAGGEAESDEGGIAVRVDSHPVLRDLLERAGGWITSTSLNAHGAAPARTAEEAAATLGAMGPARVPTVLLDGGGLEPSPPSTIVSLVGDRARILREGAVAADVVERVLAGLEAMGDAP